MRLAGPDWEVYLQKLLLENIMPRIDIFVTCPVANNPPRIPVGLFLRLGASTFDIHCPDLPLSVAGCPGPTVDCFPAQIAGENLSASVIIFLPGRMG